ncbi:acyl-CoA dehydrogenase [Pseudonocardia sulfidoxydans NBRC 16205]|uniref:Acyl-CoA dehydrogenase n=1 Tax=Pseudonocardia sulfidoxydans NBRC 16205 TaxID=1223511 RepID=A0A511DHH5_9PSEU|nr:acyl-CoA dehydrogenase family protein [Pseudonocardia sulfidoxydans]GEL24245.1 acyl-CoA dehydrogenase [Pseudonocardia sulfidoxydans NBRC 16205]
MYIPVTLTEEQKALRSAVRSLFDAHMDEDRRRAAIDSERGYSEDLWQLMAEMGLHALVVPEEYGGAGGDMNDLRVVFHEAGRVLLTGPFFASAAMATPLVIEAATDEARRHLLPALAAGELVAAPAICEESGSWNLDDVRLPATVRGGEVVLEGTKHYVLDALVADVLLVVVRTGDGLALVSVAADDPRVEIERLETLDLTRRVAAVRFHGCTGRLLSAPGQDVIEQLRKALDAAVVALAAEQSGAMEALLESALSYTGLRHQFGRPIATFQVIKHKLADMTLDVERSLSASSEAARAFVDPAQRAVAASTAKAFASDAFVKAATEHIQVHGGIGFTWEHHAHLYYRRAASSREILGSPQEHRGRIVSLLLDDMPELAETAGVAGV